MLAVEFVLYSVKTFHMKRAAVLPENVSIGFVKFSFHIIYVKAHIPKNTQVCSNMQRISVVNKI